MTQSVTWTPVRVTLTVALGVALALFLHDSGQYLFGILQAGVRKLFLPLLLSIVLAYVLSPTVNWLERQGVRRLNGALLLYAVLVGGSGIVLYFFLPEIARQISEFRTALPGYVARVLDVAVRSQDVLRRELGLFGTVDLQEVLSGYFTNNRRHLWTFTVDATNLIFLNFLLVPLFAFFFLFEGSAFKRAVIARTPNRYFESLLMIFHQVNVSLGVFVRGRVYEAFFVTLLSWFFYHLAGLKYAWFFAVLAGVTSIVPVFGTLVSVVLTCTFALLDSGSLGLALFILLIILVVHLVDNMIVIPLFVVKSTSLHFLTGVLAILFGGIMAGVLGMIIAIPVVSIAQLILREVFRHFRANAAAGRLPHP